jgi:hypothetical protein
MDIEIVLDEPNDLHSGVALIDQPANDLVMGRLGTSLGGRDVVIPGKRLNTDKELEPIESKLVTFTHGFRLSVGDHILKPAIRTGSSQGIWTVTWGTRRLDDKYVVV